MRHLIIAPPPILKNHVKCFWFFEFKPDEGEKIQISTFINNSSGINVLSYPDQGIFKATINGMQTHRILNQPVSSIRVFGALFYPNAMNRFFGISANELINEEVQINDLATWNIADALFNEVALDEQIKLLTEYLVSMLNSRNDKFNVIDQVLNFIHEKDGLLTVTDVRRNLGISERHLERIFNSRVGVSPRHYLKVTRFQKAMSILKKSSDAKLTDIAYKLNYADQSHFSRHVRQLSGLTPSELHKKLMKISVNQHGDTRYLIDLVD